MEPAKNLILVHTPQLIPIKGYSSGRMVSSGISDVVIASVNSEKTRLKKVMRIIIISVMNKLQEMAVFSSRKKLTSAVKLRPEK